jgi:hypothetical protein
MEFTPKTEAELNEKRLLPEGVYDFETQAAEDTVSKSSGKEMIKVRLRVWGDDGGTNLVTDYLMGGGMLYKLLHFCATGGLMHLYESGRLTASDCVGVCGKVSLKVEPAGQFPAKNVVKDYVVGKGEKAAASTPRATVVTTHNAPKPVVDDVDGEDIPF